MDNTDFAREIEDALDAKLKEKPAEKAIFDSRVPFKPRLDANTKPAQASLSEQWDMHRTIGAELRSRLRLEKTRLLTDHDRAWLDLRHRYEERIADTMATMKAELADEQRRLVADYQAKARDLDLLAQRIEEEQ